MTSFVNYEKKKVCLGSMFSRLSGIFADFLLTNQVNSVSEDRRQLENEQFHLVVVGEFSRGKSTFVNALLGRKMLPSSKSPTTAVISKIVYDETPGYIVHYHTGEEKAVSEKEFESIKAQSEGSVLQAMKSAVGAAPKVKLNEIEYVEIRYPLPFCKNHVEVIDTPGTNDLNVGRVEITHNYLRKADAAILVLSATQPLTRSELDFLRQHLLGNQINYIFVIINGKDKCKGGDESRVMEYVMNQLSSEVMQGLRIFPVSSKQALTWRRRENGETLKASVMKSMPSSIEESGFPVFEEALLRFLDEEQGRAKLEKYAARIRHYFEVIETQIQSQYEAANHSTDDLRHQLIELRPKVRKAKADASHIMKEMEAGLVARETELVNEAQKAFQNMKQAAVRAVDKCDYDASDDEIQHQIAVETTPIQEELLERTGKLQEGWTREAWDKSLAELRRIWSDMELKQNENLPQALRHNFSVKFDRNIRSDSGSDDIGVKDWLKLGLGTAVFGLPFLATMAGVYGLFKLCEYGGKKEEKEDRKKAVRKQYDEQYQPFVSKTKEQYRSAVSQLCAQLEAEVKGRLDDMEQQLASIVQMKEASERDVGAVKEKLTYQYERVQQMKKELAEVMA